MERIPGPRALKHICFHTVMQPGLKQIDWLTLNNFIGRHRRHVVHTVFEDAKHQTLQLLFPSQDLGFIYKDSWLIGRGKSGPDHVGPLTFEPDLELGGRMPHFWLDDKDGRQISVLNLPFLMIGSDPSSCYVLLIAGKAQITPSVFDVTQNREFQHIVTAEIRLHPNCRASRIFLSIRIDLSFYRQFLPFSYARMGTLAGSIHSNRFLGQHTNPCKVSGKVSRPVISAITSIGIKLIKNRLFSAL